MAKQRLRPVLMEMKHEYCPGCGHGIVARLLAECLEELGCEEKILLNVGVGCCCLLNSCLAVDTLQCAHGRASASATGMKRVMPQTLVLSYQGDGDAYTIGLAETMNAAYRNENITLIVINNSNFGMTGGQMSWTTLEGQKTATSIYGRDTKKTGKPIHVPEMIAQYFDTAFVARGSVYDAAHIMKLKGYIRQAIEAQLAGEGHAMVEVLSPCPTNWGMEPLAAMARVRDALEEEYPLGIFKQRKQGGEEA